MNIRIRGVIFGSLLGIGFLIILWAWTWVACAMVDSCWSAL